MFSDLELPKDANMNPEPEGSIPSVPQDHAEDLSQYTFQKFAATYFQGTENPSPILSRCVLIYYSHILLSKFSQIGKKVYTPHTYIHREVICGHLDTFRRFFPVVLQALKIIFTRKSQSNRVCYRCPHMETPWRL